jgi:putative flippase GtrA
MAQRTLVAARWLVGAGGATVNFVLNRRWALGRRDLSSRRQGLRYAVTAFPAVCLGTFIGWLGLISTHWDPRLLHVLSMILVWLSFTYPMFKRWVFRTPAPAAQGDFGKMHMDAAVVNYAALIKADTDGFIKG